MKRFLKVILIMAVVFGVLGLDLRPAVLPWERQWEMSVSWITD